LLRFHVSIWSSLLFSSASPSVFIIFYLYMC
jgi:hypothetical protein